MSNRFDAMRGKTFADLIPKNGVKATSPDNEAIARSFAGDPQLHSTCSVCRKQIYGSIEELSAHIESCDGPG